jgi:energy-coupling factor transporter ATP-binding protein EcfA2
MRQRLGLAVSLLRQPRLLILDEPTNGLDPGGIRDMRDLIKRLAGEGLTIFLSSLWGSFIRIRALSWENLWSPWVVPT